MRGNLTDGVTGPLDPSSDAWKLYAFASSAAAICQVTVVLDAPMRMQRVAVNFLQVAKGVCCSV